MQDHQFAKPWLPKEVRDNRLIALWLFPADSPLLPISQEEETKAYQLNPRLRKQFQHSRGCVRKALADVLQIPALDIPLKANSNEPPSLPYGWGFISFSHCRDALFIGWSSERIGVDIERSDRSIAAEAIAKRCFTKKDQHLLSSLGKEALRKNVLKQWVIKESSIKWQRGKISKDLIDWQCSNDYLNAYHSSKNHHLRITSLNHQDWQMSVARAYNHITYEPILCIEN